MYRHLLALVIVTVLLMSCAPSSVVKEENLTAEEVFKRVEERNEAVRTLRGRGTVSIESPERSISGAFTLSMKKPDSLLMDVRGPFGIHVGSLSLTRQSFQYYNSLENTLMQGTPDSSALLSILRVNLSVDKIFESFSGSYPVVKGSLLRFSSTGDEYLAAFSQGGNILEYRIDAGTFIVTDYLVKDSDDKVLFKAESSMITTGSNVPTPSALSVAFPDEARKVTLHYREITLNEDVQCSFRAPKGAEIITWKQR